MPEAVIVATGRTPIGRANKGSLVTCRPDNMLADVMKAVLAKVPQVEPQMIEDVIVGCGMPAGESGHNIARVAAILAGWDVPGCTVHRYCASSVVAMRSAMHTVRAGEGDVFMCGGVEQISRYMAGFADAGGQNPLFDEARARTEKRSSAVTEPWAPPSGLPDVYIAMGQTAENVAELRNVSREDMDRFAALSQSPRVRVTGQRVLRPRDHPGHVGGRNRGVQGRRPPPGHDDRSAGRLKARLPGGGRRDGRRTPVRSTTCRGGRGDVGHEGVRARSTPLARIVATGSRPWTRRSWVSGRSRRRAMRSSGRR